MPNAECRVPNYKLQIKIGMGAEGGEKGRVKMGVPTGAVRKRKKGRVKTLPYGMKC